METRQVKILLPLDGSALAENAVTYVHLLKPLGDLRVRLITAIDVYQGMDIGGTYEEWQETQASQAVIIGAYLKTQAEQLAEGGIAVETDVCHGPVGQTIIADAARFGADMVLISTHGRSGFQRWRFGSVADKVIRGGEGNTLVIGPNLKDGYAKRALKSVLVPLDGSELAEQALPLGERYAKALGARLHLVKAASYPVAAEDLTGFNYSPALFESIVSGSQTYLNNRAAGSGLKNVETKVLIGPAADQLEEYIKAKSIDLVVMTSHGRGGLLRTALGSVTDRIIGGVAPVLVVRPAHATP